MKKIHYFALLQLTVYIMTCYLKNLLNGVATYLPYGNIYTTKSVKFKLNHLYFTWKIKKERKIISISLMIKTNQLNIFQESKI